MKREKIKEGKGKGEVGCGRLVRGVGRGEKRWKGPKEGNWEERKGERGGGWEDPSPSAELQCSRSENLICNLSGTSSVQPKR